ncbi:hypothetical protein X975_20052, partial [Stegodyphus mimosarum]
MSESCSESSQLLLLPSRFSRAVNCNFDGFIVSNHLRRRGANGDRQCEALTPSAPSDESQIVELRYLIFHDCGGISKFTAKVLIIPGSNADHRPV